MGVASTKMIADLITQKCEENSQKRLIQKVKLNRMRWQMEQISSKCRGWFEVELVTWLYLFGNQMNYIDKKLTGNTVGFGSRGPWFFRTYLFFIV